MKKSRLICINLLILNPLLLAVELTKQAAFFERHCTDCHDDETQKGNFNLTSLQMDFTNPDNLIKWKNVYDRIESGEMPPKKKSRPPEADLKDALSTLGTQLTEAETQGLIANGGRTMVRRMNRAEYENTLRDLLHLPLLQIKGFLPEDAQKYGFDKVAGALDISHIQMTKYLQTADIALRQAILPASEKPETKTWRAPAADLGSSQQAITNHYAAPLVGLKLTPSLKMHIRGNPQTGEADCFQQATYEGKTDSIAVLTNQMGGHQPQGIQIDTFNPSVAGWYNVKFSIWALRWERTYAAPATSGMTQAFTEFGPPYFQDPSGEWKATRLPTEILSHHSWETFMENIEFYGKGERSHTVRASLNGVPIGYFEAASLKPKEHEFKIWLKPSDFVSFHTMSLLSPGPTNSMTKDGVRSYTGPGVAYDWFEVTGPLIDQWPPASQQAVLGDKPITELVTEQSRAALMENFATRAFRRPLNPGEIKPYIDFVESEVKRGSKVEESMIAAYKALLCSPDFLFIGLESGAPEAAKKGLVTAGAYTLASRLSYFLWDSMPDQTLLELAANGSITQPEVLQKQVERLLLDDRSERFVEHFTDEWLDLKKIDATTPDNMLYPEYDTWLKDSMLQETRATFRRMIMQNRGARETVASDSILINQRLAELYDIKGVNGADIREVKIPENSPRGGFITQAAVLKVTANGTASSPILRGVWVMERILGIPRQPVPQNIPAVEPDASGATSIRQIIEKHRADPSCASCHAKMDPLGLPLEKFDVIGGYRDRYRIAGGAKEGQPSVRILSGQFARHVAQIPLGVEIDATGVLANGQEFADLNSFRKLLTAHENVLARNITRQLMIYATGAGIRFSDRAGIDQIVAKTKSTNYGLRSTIQEIVASELFQAK